MGNTKIITKQLAGKEDLLIGVGTVEQERSTSTKIITKLNVSVLQGALVVDTIEEMEALSVVNLDTLTVTVSDLSRGGVFNYDASLLSEDNQGTNFNGWIRQGFTSINVKWFGAKGDGSTNDTEAIYNAAQYIELNNGGKLVFPKGTYIVGKQVFAGETGLGYSYQNSTICRIEDCTNPVILESCGAIFKMAEGLHYGSFDPVTGIPTTGINTNNDNRGRLGEMITLINNRSVSILGHFELDGNDSNLIIGGDWGDTGIQLSAYGLYTDKIDNLIVDGLYAHHHGLDGLSVGYAGLVEGDEGKPTTLNNIVTEYNGRQGLSIVGGNAITINNGKFNHTGKGAIATAPGAGIDFEPEGSIGRRITVNNSEFINNTSEGVIADSGDSSNLSFHDCKFIGTTQRALWLNKPDILFDNCKFIGSVLSKYGASSNRKNATKFRDCYFSDDITEGYNNQAYNDGLLLQTDSAGLTYFDNCTMKVTQDKIGRLDNCIINKLHIDFVTPTANITEQDWAVIFWGSKLTDVSIDESQTGTAYTDGLYVGVSNTTYFGDTKIISASNKLKWTSWSSGAGGYVGYHGEDNPSISTRSVNIHRDNRSDQWGGLNRQYYDDAAPTSGSYTRGDIVWNQDPTPGETLGWSCTVTGSPGTWSEMEAIPLEGSITPTIDPGTSGSITLNSSFNAYTYIRGKDICFAQGLLEVVSVSSPVGSYIGIEIPFTAADLAQLGGRTAAIAFSPTLGVMGAWIQENDNMLYIKIDASTVIAGTQFYLNFNYRWA